MRSAREGGEGGGLSASPRKDRNAIMYKPYMPWLNTNLLRVWVMARARARAGATNEPRQLMLDAVEGELEGSQIHGHDDKDEAVL